MSYPYNSDSAMSKLSPDINLYKLAKTKGVCCARHKIKHHAAENNKTYAYRCIGIWSVYGARTPTFLKQALVGR